MENSEYIVVNKTDIQKEKEELKKLINKYIGYAEQEIYDKIDELCSQSTPLIPEIEKAYSWGYTHCEDGCEQDVNDCTSNLKLEI